MEQAFFLLYGGEGSLHWSDLAERPLTSREREWWARRLHKQKVAERER